MKLNIGCGGRRIEGYTGVDVVARPAADIVAPAHRIPLATGSVTEIMAIHLLEHVYPWDVDAVLKEWYRLLAPGGKLVAEMPDVMKCARNLLEGRNGEKHADQLHMWGWFGDPRLKDPHMLHHWSYTFRTIEPLLGAAGFVDITEHDTKFHAAGYVVRDFRVEAIKPVPGS